MVLPPFDPGVRARGNSIQFDFYFEGIRNRETIKLNPNLAKNIRFANNKMGAILHEIEIGTFNYAKFFPNSKRLHIFGHTMATNMTISETVDWYFELKKKDWRREHIRASGSYIKNHIKPGVGNLLLRKVKPSQIRYWLSQSKAKPKLLNNCLSILRGAFTMAKKDQLITNDPMSGVENFKIAKVEPSPFSIEEIQMILDNFEDEATKNVFDFAFWSGISTGEQIGLQWDDVDFEDNSVYIRRSMVSNKLEETKNSSRWRRLDLLPPAKRALERQKQLSLCDKWVFINPTTGKIWTYSPLGKRWKKAIDKTKINYRNGYTTRHTYASILLSIGIPLSWLKKQMGHSNYRMLEEVYSRWIDISPNKRKEALKWFVEMSQNGHIPDELVPFIKTIQ